MVDTIEPEFRGSSQTRQRLDCGDVSVALSCDDPAVVDYVVEFFHPWFRPTRRAAEWSVAVITAAPAYAATQRRRPADAESRPCFAHDQKVLSLPAWLSDGAMNVCDAERSCFLRLRPPGHVDLIADPRTRRWRFTLSWILQEIAATRLRQTCADLHAAAVAHSGRALLIAGPKGAGKTTLSCHLMRSHGWRSIANDRSFIRAAGSVPEVLGMPTAVKLRAATLGRFPELGTGLPPVARPYLYSLAELETASASEEPREAVDLALTPNQLAARLGTVTSAGAPLGAIVFPGIRDGENAWTLEPLKQDEVRDGLNANGYGAAAGERPMTLFEELGGGRRRAPQRCVDATATAVAGYRLRLGRGAYAGGTLGERLLRLLTP